MHFVGIVFFVVKYFLKYSQSTETIIDDKGFVMRFIRIQYTRTISSVYTVFYWNSQDMFTNQIDFYRGLDLTVEIRGWSSRTLTFTFINNTLEIDEWMIGVELIDKKYLYFSIVLIIWHSSPVLWCPVCEGSQLRQQVCPGALDEPPWWECLGNKVRAGSHPQSGGSEISGKLFRSIK